jgi:hypothetical protein
MFTRLGCCILSIIILFQSDRSSIFSQSTFARLPQALHRLSLIAFLSDFGLLTLTKARLRVLLLTEKNTMIVTKKLSRDCAYLFGEQRRINRWFCTLNFCINRFIIVLNDFFSFLVHYEAGCFRFAIQDRLDALIAIAAH